MDTLNKVIAYRRKMYIEKMWKRIFDIGWGIKTVDHKLLRKQLPEKYTEKEISQLKEFSVYKRRELAKVLDKYVVDNNLGHGYYSVSDDGFWDLTAHIVGLGKERYDSVVNDPSIAREISLSYMYKENFEYSFHID